MTNLNNLRVRLEQVNIMFLRKRYDITGFKCYVVIRQPGSAGKAANEALDLDNFDE